MQLRNFALWLGTLAFGVALAPLGSTTVHASDAPTEAQAHVDVTVTSGGAAVHFAGRQLAWDGNAILRQVAGDHEHAVAIAMRRSEDGQQLHVALSYTLDGAIVVASQDVDASMAEPVRLASADGKSEIVFTVKAQAPRKPIEIDSSDDPLGGL